MSKKQTVPLSQILDRAVNELHPSPCIKAYGTIGQIVKSIPQASVALRVQLIAKMRAYCNNFLPKREMYYCLYLTDYLVNTQPVFRKQLLDVDFISLFERIGEFERFKKVSKKPGIVNEKALRVLQLWGTQFIEDLEPYHQMYEKYLKKGVVFPEPENNVFKATEEKSALKEMEELMKPIEECIMLIKDTLQEVETLENIKVRLQAMTTLHKRAVNLNSKFNMTYVKYASDDKNKESEEFKKFVEVDKEFSSLIEKLSNYINKASKPDEDIYRTYTTGHLKSLDKAEIPNKPTYKQKQLNPNDMAAIAALQQITEQQDNGLRKKNSVSIMPPPSRTGAPLRNKNSVGPRPSSQLTNNSNIQQQTPIITTTTSSQFNHQQIINNNDIIDIEDNTNQQNKYFEQQQKQVQVNTDFMKVNRPLHNPRINQQQTLRRRNFTQSESCVNEFAELNKTQQSSAQYQSLL